jgi:hypothetical protein
MADPKKIIGGLGKASKRLLMTEEEKLAQKYAAGAQYADPLAPATMRMSEALGNVGAEGKTLNFTEADRSRVFGSNRGGVGFSGLQHYSLPHKKANTVWGFGNKTTAEKKVKQNDPEKSIWTTFVGSPNQHKSNTVVLKDAIKEFQNAVKAGNVPAGQIKLMNDRIRMATDDKTGVLLFDDAFDLTDPSALGAANSFARRSAVGDVLLGEGVKGEMRRKAFKEENKGETWKDSGQMDSILRRETDPDLIDAGTYDVGNRFFVMDGKIIERPDLNEAFPLQVTGTDLGIKYQLVPPNKAMRDFYKLREGRKDKNDRLSPVNYYDLSRAEPSQFVDEDYLTFLQKEGHKDGGSIDADQELKSMIADHLDSQSADQELRAMIEGHFASGGGVSKANGGGAFKKLEFMAEGGTPMQAGGVAKGAAKGFKKLFAERDVLPVESQAAKQARLNMMPTARIGLEAPGILIPSKMNNVREAVRNMKGNYGARRVERAADEIPNLERMYQEDALKQAFTGDNAAAMMTIDPSRFEEFATPIGSTFTRPNSVRHTSAGDRVTFPEYLDYLKSLEGFDDVPFLEINKQLQGTMAKPYISGHEGRHRNRAMSQSGEKAGLVQLLPRSELREPFPRRTQEEYIEALKKELEMTGNIVLPQINKNQPNLPQRPAIDLPDIYAEGGSVFKTLQFNEPQHFDGGGIASPEENNTYAPESFFDSKRYSDIKKNASEMFGEAKQSLASDYDRLKNSARARAQLAKIAAAQLAGGGPDLAHLGVDLLVDPLKSVTVDKLLTKPAYRSVLEGPAKAGEKQERVPMFGSISDSLKTADGLPIGGSEHLIKRAQDAGLMSQGRFSPLTEIPAAILTGVGVSKLGKGAVKGYDKLTGANSGKLNPLQPEAMTAPAGTPQGATYATKQEGPFYRVSPTSLDVSGAKNRGIREAPELQGEGLDLGTTGQAGREVPQLLSPEEVGRIIADPAANQPLQIAQRFTKETQGTDFTLPDIPESSLAKQSAIGRAQQLAVEGSPEYKSAVFDAYAKQMPDLLEQVGAKNYDDLMEKAYRQMAKETDEQFKRLPYNFSYHRAGEGNYNGAMDMASDVHGNKHLYVYQGGDPHDFLNRLDKASGLNENEKFRAVHDLLGHAIYGNQFGPKGEEIAWAVHQQMYSPLARLAMTAETRGQNSMVNYSPLNVKVKSAIAKLDELEVQALRKGDKALVDEIRAAKRQEYANFEFAPNKAVLLPPEFVDPKFTGGLPDYLSAANRPAKGTETQSVLTHFSNDPNLQFLDPTRYGTGIKGAEAERLREGMGGVRDRSYVYLGEPGTVSPESGLGVNRYRGESQNLYDITKDPLSFRALARESNRTPFTAKYNAGITHPLQEANDYERLVKEYGYEGMINPNASKPMGIMFKPTPVQPRKRGGLTQLKAR